MTKKPFKCLDSFFYKGRHFRCRFTGESLGRFKGKQLIPNDQVSHVLAVLASGQAYKFTCAKSYIPQLSLSDAQEAFDADPNTPTNSGLKVMSFSVLPSQELS